MFVTETPEQVDARTEEALKLWEEKVACVKRIAEINRRLVDLKINPHKV